MGVRCTLGCASARPRWRWQLCVTSRGLRVRVEAAATARRGARIDRWSPSTLACDPILFLFLFVGDAQCSSISYFYGSLDIIIIHLGIILHS
jgi:hypothetical protein